MTFAESLKKSLTKGAILYLGVASYLIVFHYVAMLLG